MGDLTDVTLSDEDTNSMTNWWSQKDNPRQCGNASVTTWWQDFQQMPVAPSVGQIWILWNLWPNLQVAPSGDQTCNQQIASTEGQICNQWNNLSYRLNSLGLLCLWQCKHIAMIVVTVAQELASHIYLAMSATDQWKHIYIRQGLWKDDILC